MSLDRLYSSIIRSALAATAAALLLTAAAPSALAVPAEPNAKIVKPQTIDATEVAARRHRRYYRGNPGAAFMGAVLGTMGAIIAEQQRRDYYDRYYGPYPYGGPYYYGGPYPYYGPRYYPY